MLARLARYFFWNACVLSLTNASQKGKIVFLLGYKHQRGNVLSCRCAWVHEAVISWRAKKNNGFSVYRNYSFFYMAKI